MIDANTIITEKVTSGYSDYCGTARQGR